MKFLSLKFCAILFSVVLFLTSCGSSNDIKSVENTDNTTFVEPVCDKTEVQNEYEDMLNATEFLSLTDQGYTFKNYPITSDNIIDVNGNIEITQGAMYEEIGAGIDLYCEFGLDQVLDDNFYFALFGSNTKPDDLDKRLSDLYGFITSEGTEKNILKKFETLNTVCGEFDYDNRIYSFEISDLKQTADDLQISQKMLGYTLAKLNEYTDNLKFDGNHLSCSFEVRTFS